MAYATLATPGYMSLRGAGLPKFWFAILRLTLVFGLFASVVAVAFRTAPANDPPSTSRPRSTRPVAIREAPPRVEKSAVVQLKGPLDEDSSLDMVDQVWARRIPEAELARQLAAFGDDDGKVRFGPVKVKRRLVETVVRAARRADYDPALLMAIADKESSLRAMANASTSSAAGLFQFIEKTWLQAVREFGAQHGLAREAAEIEGPDDNPYIADEQERARVLALRERPYLATVMAAEMLKRDAGKVAENVGRNLSAGETYLIHFLGQRDAKLFLSRLADEPQVSAAATLPRPAKANKPIFYERGKAKPLSVAKVHEKFEEMMGMRVDRYSDVSEIAGAMAYAE